MLVQAVDLIAGPLKQLQKVSKSTHGSRVPGSVRPRAMM